MAEYIAEDYIETASGRKFHFNAPTPDMIDIEDIAHALGNLCRYNGHCRQYYSVAEHCVLLANKYINENPDDPATALAFLLHDAAEAYMCDMPRPVKYSLSDFRVLEAKLDAAVAKRFGIPYPMLPIIKEWDSRIIVDERAQNMSKSGNVWGVDHLEPLGIKLQCWKPWEASSRFLLLFKALNIKPA